jgi:hypothetical protein
MALPTQKVTIGTTSMAGNLRGALLGLQSSLRQLKDAMQRMDLAKESGNVGTVLQNFLGAPTLDDATEAYNEGASAMFLMTTTHTLSSEGNPTINLETTINQAANKLS